MPLRDPLLPYVRPAGPAPAFWMDPREHVKARGEWVRAMYAKRGQLLTPTFPCPSCAGPTYYDRQWRGLACLDALCNWQATVEALGLTPAALERYLSGTP